MNDELIERIYDEIRGRNKHERNTILYMPCAWQL